MTDHPDGRSRIDQHFAVWDRLMFALTCGQVTRDEFDARLAFVQHTLYPEIGRASA